MNSRSNPCQQRACHTVTRVHGFEGTSCSPQPWQFVSSTDDPLGWRVSRRVNASVFCPVHHTGASLRISTKPRAPTSLIVLSGSFGCREMLSTHRALLRMHLPCPRSSGLMGPAQFIQTISSTDKTSVESRGIYNVQEVKHLFV